MAGRDYIGACGPVRALRVSPPFNKIGWEGITLDPEDTPLTASDCLFCRIAAGVIPADVVYQDDHVVAFRDINPHAPVHFLVIPRRHVASLNAAQESDRDLLGRLFLAARDQARADGIAESGYRTVLNVGPDAGQVVQHVHMHVLGGRELGWPPG